MQQEIGIKFAVSFYERNQTEDTFKGIHVMKNDKSRTINHLDNASKPKDFEKWSTILKWDENVTKHKMIEGIVCKKQYVPSMKEMIQSLIPKCQMFVPIIFKKWSHKNPINHCWKQEILSCKKVFWKEQRL